MSHDYADKVRKLLAKAESTDNEEERDALTALAFKLMQEHAIDEARINAETGRKAASNRVVVRSVKCDGIYGQALQALAFAVADSLNGVTVVNSKQGNDRVALLIGFESELLVVETLFASLTLQAHSALKTAWNTKRHDVDWWSSMQKFTWKRSFMFGFAEEVSHRFAAMRKVTQDEVQISTSTEVALVDRDNVVAAWIKLNMQLKQGRSVKVMASGATMGRDAGRRADLRQGGVTGRTPGALE